MHHFAKVVFFGIEVLCFNPQYGTNPGHTQFLLQAFPVREGTRKGVPEVEEGLGAIWSYC